jgi:hypothetical protein
MTFAVATQPLPDGPVRRLTGLYGEYGSPVFATCRIEQNRLLCNRYPIELRADGPQIVQVDGQIGDGALRVDTWAPVAWDALSQRAAGQAYLDRVAPDLAAYDWSQIARPDFAESSQGYHPSEDELKGLPVELAGYDTASDRIIWRAQGPDLPRQKPLVRRFSALYIVTDPAGKRPTEMFVTIEGYVEE